jgi:hypothetical protein
MECRTSSVILRSPGQTHQVYEEVFLQEHKRGFAQDFAIRTAIHHCFPKPNRIMLRISSGFS